MSKIRRTAPALLAVLATPVMAAAPLPHAMLGEWQSPCDAWGVPATCTASWEVGLHASHWVQNYRIVDAQTGAQIFAGRGLYQVQDGKVDGIWEDSRGQVLPLAGTFDENGLNVIWGDAAREIGRSVYTLESGTLAAVDSVLTESGWRVFMQIAYQPVPAE